MKVCMANRLNNDRVIAQFFGVSARNPILGTDSRANAVNGVQTIVLGPNGIQDPGINEFEIRCGAE